MKQNTFNRVRLILSGVTAVSLLAVGISPVVLAQKMDSKMTKAHFHVKISAAQAKAVALKKYPGKVEGKIALEDEEGSWQYAVNIRAGKTLREVMVNATTGKIANVEVTTKAEEASEQKAELKASKNHK